MPDALPRGHPDPCARLPELERVLCLEGVAPDDDSGPLF